MNLQGKVALITGGGTGLGKEISLKLASEGTDIAVIYSRSQAEAEATVAELKALGRRAIAIKADVSSSADVKVMIDTVVRELGGIDILVNNAGSTIFADFKDLDAIKEEDWDRIMEVNVKSIFLCSREAAPHMKARGAGRIVNVTSVAGLKAGGSSIPYSVSKAAGTMLTRCLAMSLAPEITVNNVAPGLMDTRWGRLWGDEHIERSGKSAPLGHLATVPDIADAAVMLIKNDSMTGQAIVVDSGSMFH